MVWSGWALKGNKKPPPSPGGWFKQLSQLNEIVNYEVISFLPPGGLLGVNPAFTFVLTFMIISLFADVFQLLFIATVVPISNQLK